MNKEFKERLDHLENELKESKKEIHKLKGSVSFIVENTIRRLLSRFTRKQIVLGSLIVLFSVSIIGIAGTVSKTYTFSAGEVVSASKFNTNFDTLYTLVNGNLDDDNINGISGSKITSGTIDPARIDNVSSTAINYGNGVFVYSSYDPDNNSTVVDGSFTRNESNIICDYAKFKIIHRECNNTKALVSFSTSDEIRDMISNYSVPDSAVVFNQMGQRLADNFTKLIDGSKYPFLISNIQDAVYASGVGLSYWHGTVRGGIFATDSGYAVYDCNGFTSHNSSDYGSTHSSIYNSWNTSNARCNLGKPLLCICY